RHTRFSRDWSSDVCSSDLRFLEELKHHDVDIYDTCLLALERSQREDTQIAIDPATFACCPDNSIDYAVMEKTSRACVVPLSAGRSEERRVGHGCRRPWPR